MSRRGIRDFFSDSDVQANLCRIGIIVIIAGAAGLTVHEILSKYLDKKSKTKTYILVNNGEVSIYEDNDLNIKIKIKDKEKYGIVEFDEHNWIIYVYCKDSNTYAEFIKSNIYFDENNKIIFDTYNLTEEKYEYFSLESEGIEKEPSRVRKG